MIRILIIALVLTMMPYSVSSARADRNLDYTTICAPFYLHIPSQDEPIHLSLEIANTDLSMMRGLMFREYLAPLGGMIFVFDRPQIATFWMKNTLIPLDILYVAEDGEILTIHQNARPHDLTQLSSYLPVKYGVELRGGTVAKLGIQTGDRISGFEDILNVNP